MEQENSNLDIIQAFAEQNEIEIPVFNNPSFESAIIGISHDNRAIYSYSKMIDCLVDETMSYEEAVEFIDYNTLRILSYYSNAPIIMYDIEDIIC